MTTKGDLRATKRGRLGTLVRYQGRVYVVKDLMDRVGYNRPERVGIGPEDRGIAFGVSLADIEVVR